jgi:hypothetical protein
MAPAVAAGSSGVDAASTADDESIHDETLFNVILVLSFIAL